MVGIILATHGNFATGIQQSASMIFGEQPNVAAVTLQPNEGPDDVRKKMEEAVASFEDPEQVLILVDLWGGTPFNQANGLIAGHEDTWAIVAGLNLPMLIDAYASRMMMDTAHELAVQISGSAKEGVLEREEMSSTSLNHIALPHGNPAMVQNTRLVIGRMNHPILWDDSKVSCAFLFAVSSEMLKEKPMLFNTFYRTMADPEVEESIKKLQMEKNLPDEVFRQKLFQILR